MIYPVPLACANEEDVCVTKQEWNIKSCRRILINTSGYSNAILQILSPSRPFPFFSIVHFKLSVRTHPQSDLLYKETNSPHSLFSVNLLIVHLRNQIDNCHFVSLHRFRPSDCHPEESIMYFANILLSIAGAASIANALGSNCQDSGVCADTNANLSFAIEQLKGMDQLQRFSDGQHITCVDIDSEGNSSLCLSYQGTGRSWTVFQTAWFAQSLVEQGCQACGSLSMGSDHGELVASVITKTTSGLDTSGARRGMDMVQLAVRAGKR